MSEESSGFTCPVPLTRHAQVLLGHGGGGRLMHELLEQLFLPAFSNPALEERHDGARIDLAGAPLAFTTDAYVVRPLFFPGGDIGKLAVYGTVNDLAMCGARPAALSAAFILEEGLAFETLERVVGSMRLAAAAAGVPLVTGDTKVVERGKGDGLYVTTAGVGVRGGRTIGPREVRPGDALLVSGDVGRHGVAILVARAELALESSIESDCADLWPAVAALLAGGIAVHCLRDCTRGGFATSVIEVACQAGASVDLDADAIPVRREVRGACELLGLDPLYVANEGRFIAWVPGEQAGAALAILREQPVSAGARIAGRVRAAGPDAAGGLVTLHHTLGSARVLDLLSGEQLPRIC